MFLKTRCELSSTTKKQETFSDQIQFTESSSHDVRLISVRLACIYTQYLRFFYNSQYKRDEETKSRSRRSDSKKATNHKGFLCD